MRESAVERYLVKQVKAAGGFTAKWTSPASSGLPDRVVVIAGSTVFVEVKAPGKEPRPLQLARHREIERAGGKVLVIDSKEGVDAMVRALSCQSSPTGT